jgi:replicative DNA helicase
MSLDGYAEYGRQFIAQLAASTTLADDIDAVAWLNADALPDPAHGVIWDAARALAATSPLKYSPMSLSTAVRRKGNQRAQAELLEVIGTGTTYLDLNWLAERLHETYSMRLISQTAMRIQQTVANGAASIEDRMAQATAFANDIQNIAHPPGHTEINGLHTVRDFIDASIGEPDWIVPHFVGLGERWLILGVPGSGKSVLARQMAMSVASGIHPLFPTRTIPAHRTLFIDLENPEDILRKEYRRQADGMGMLRRSVSNDQAWLWYQPGGIDLANSEDYRSFRAVIDKVQPALVCFSPVYKAHSANGEWDVLAGTVTSAIESVRARMPVTFWMEHHASKAGTSADGLDPYGSGRWTRWPDFVVALLADEPEPPFSSLRFKVQKARDFDRDFPTDIKQNGSWSWTGRYSRELRAWDGAEAVSA